MSSPIQPGPDPTALRTAYTFGIFSMALIDVFVFLIPVYAGISLGMSDGQIGTLVGARSFISFFLSIHAGVLMDRFGVRRITLIFTGIVVVCAPLFPLMTTFQSLLLLQVISGFAISMAWSGGQTLIARIAEGDAEYIGRFSSFARMTIPLNRRIQIGIVDDRSFGGDHLINISSTDLGNDVSSNGPRDAVGAGIGCFWAENIIDRCLMNTTRGPDHDANA